MPDARVEQDDDVVVRVTSSALCGTDLHMYDGRASAAAGIFNKGVTVGFGRTHDRRYTTHLRDLVISGRARPSQIITHHEPLENAPSTYDLFDRRVDGIVKAVFNHS